MPSRISALPIIAVMLVVAGVAGVGGAASAARATPASPRTVQASFEFTGLTPGVEKSTLKPFTTATVATIAAVAPIAPSNARSAPDVIWTGELCDANGDGCRPFDHSLTGTTLASGEHSVRVRVTTPAGSTATSSAVVASLVFAGSESSPVPQGPASPGFPLLWWGAIAAVALSAGMVLSAAQRRRARDEAAASVAVSVSRERS